MPLSSQISPSASITPPNAFRLTTTGEALRGLVNLRIDDIDRQHGLVLNALQQAKDAVVELESIADNRIGAARERAARVVPGMHHNNLGNGGTSMGLSEVSAVRTQIARLENALAEVTMRKKQLTWMREQLVPTTSYDLDCGDLMMFGIGRGNHVDLDFVGGY